MPSIKVFLSYRRDDTQHIAGRLFDRLAARFGEINVFMDVDSIALGLDFGEVTEDAVGQCDVLLALIGRNWLERDDAGHRRIDDHDDYVAIEIGVALNRRIRVIPVLTDGASAPRLTDLPENLGAYETPIDKMLPLPPPQAILELMPDQGAEPRPDGP